ncbi:Fc.00g028520.m01.CDS01 [Cosmosporella sp. VM-42]
MRYENDPKILEMTKTAAQAQGTVQDLFKRLKLSEERLHQADKITASVPLQDVPQSLMASILLFLAETESDFKMVIKTLESHLLDNGSSNPSEAEVRSSKHFTKKFDRLSRRFKFKSYGANDQTSDIRNDDSSKICSKFD